MSELTVRPPKEKQEGLVRTVQRRQEFVSTDRLRKRLKASSATNRRTLASESGRYTTQNGHHVRIQA
jgi:hypothetical protein